MVVKPSGLSAAGLLLAVVAGPASASLIMHDAVAFLAAYSDPTETIDFTVLKTGLAYSNAQYSSDFYIRTRTGLPMVDTIRSEEWSNFVNIGSTSPGCLCAWQQVTWTGPGQIKATVYSGLHLEIPRPNMVIAVNSGVDFVGLRPDSGDNTADLLSGGLTLLRLGFSPVAVVPAPDPVGFTPLP